MNVFKESFKHFKKYMPLFALCSLLSITSLAVFQLIPQILGLVVDYVLTPIFQGAPAVNNGYLAPFFVKYAGQGDPWGLLIRLVVTLFCLSACRWLLHYTRWNLAHFAGVSCEKVLRKKVFNRMITQNTLVLNKYTAGELLSITNSDIVMVKDLYTHHVPNLIDSFVMITLSVVSLVPINPYLTIVPGTVGIIMMAVTVRYTKRMRLIFNRVRSASVELNSCVTENIGGVRVIRAFAREDYEKAKFDAKNEEYRAAFFQHADTWSKYQAIFNALMQTISLASIVMALLFFFSGNPALTISAGEFVIFMTYVANISTPMMNVANILGAMQQCSISGQRMFTFLNTYNAIKEPDNPVPIGGAPNLAMKGVTLQLDDKFLLRDIDIDLPYGKTLGIMGKTGSGKTALIKTFMRHFETTHGETMLNGINIKNYSIEELRRQFSYVIQDVFLFSNTVDSNIAFADPEIDHEAVLHAARMAEADGFIQKLPEGYDTVVGERGLGLSGGQKQRVSIARALLKDAPVIVFDDSTSALDMETEKRIFNNLRENYAGRSLIIAAHRASSVMNCDEIIYLEDGRITERGSFSEMIALGGKFAEIYKAQEAQVREGIL